MVKNSYESYSNKNNYMVKKLIIPKGNDSRQKGSSTFLLMGSLHFHSLCPALGDFSSQ